MLTWSVVLHVRQEALVGYLLAMARGEADAPKGENTYKGFRLATVTGEQQYIKGNTKFFAVAMQGGGGPFAICDHTKPGKRDADAPIIGGHKGAVLDLDFNPFHEHVVASASDDSTIKVWGIPEAGLTENITEPLVDLHGHGRKVTLIRFYDGMVIKGGALQEPLSPAGKGGKGGKGGGRGFAAGFRYAPY